MLNMLNKRNKRIIASVLSIILSCTLFGNVFAANEQNVYHAPSAENARINAEIISNFNKTIDIDDGWYVELKYDSQGRIIKIFGRSGDVEKIVNITYQDDGTYKEAIEKKIINTIFETEVIDKSYAPPV